MLIISPLPYEQDSKLYGPLVPGHSSLFILSSLPSSMSKRQQSQSAVRIRARIACQYCRKSRSRCTGGPPCENCVRFGNENCGFVYIPHRKKPVAQETRPDNHACRSCRTKKAPCNGGPPCENCVVDGSDVCEFSFEPHGENRLRKSRTLACLPCRKRKVRCTGGGPPCGTCTTRGVESTCEFEKTTQGDRDNTAMHKHQNQSKGAVKSSWDAVSETDPVQQPNSTLYEGSDNKPSPYTCTALDARPICHDESLGCSEPLSTISSVNHLSDLSKTPSLDVSDLDEDAHAALPVGCSSYGKPLNVLPSPQMIDCLIERYFTSISMVKLTN